MPSWAMRRISSAMDSQWSSRWSMARMPVPHSRWSRASCPQRRAAVWSSKLAKGSSSRTQAGRRAARQASAARCFSPPDRERRGRRRRWAMPQKSRAALSRSSISARGTRRFSRQKNSSFSTVSIQNWSSGFWNSMPTRAHRSPGPRAAGSCPSTRTVPPWRNPAFWG